MWVHYLNKSLEMRSNNTSDLEAPHEMLAKKLQATVPSTMITVFLFRTPFQTFMNLPVQNIAQYCRHYFPTN